MCKYLISIITAIALLVLFYPARTKAQEISSISSCNTPDYAIRVYVSGEYAYMANRNADLQVIDISNPASPSIIGSCKTPDQARGIYVSGNYAYMACVLGGLQIIDITIPSLPRHIGSYDTPDYANDLYVLGNYVYVADRTSLLVIDISNPASPSLIGSCHTPNWAFSVYVTGNYAYVADWASGIQVVDISNPASPNIIGSCNTPGHARGVYVSGNYAYVADTGSGLQVIDISNPTSSKIIGTCDTPGQAEDIHVSGNYAYVATRKAGLQVIDISNPASPSIISSYGTPGQAFGVYVSDSYTYIADHKAGLQIIERFNPLVSAKRNESNLNHLLSDMIESFLKEDRAEGENIEKKIYDYMESIWDSYESKYSIDKAEALVGIATARKFNKSILDIFRIYNLIEHRKYGIKGIKPFDLDLIIVKRLKSIGFTLENTKWCYEGEVVNNCKTFPCSKETITRINNSCNYKNQKINSKPKPKNIVKNLNKCSKNQVYVSADMYGDQWPFTIDHGCLECINKPLIGKTYNLRAVIMHSGDNTYNINGTARGHYKNIYIDSWEIRKPHPNKFITDDGGKMIGCLHDIIEDGLQLCR